MSCTKDKIVMFFPRKLMQQTILLRKFERNRRIINSVACRVAEPVGAGTFWPEPRRCKGPAQAPASP